MKTIKIKERIQDFEGYTYKPGLYEVVDGPVLSNVEGQPAGWQVTEETAQKLLTVYPTLVTGEAKKAGK